MRVDDELLDGDVRGSGQADRIEVNAWRGGELLAAHLDVSTFGINWDATRQVQGQSTWTFADPDGALAPLATDDALAPYGSRLEVVWISGASGITVPLGEWRIRTADPVEDWLLRTTDAGDIVTRPGGGGLVSVTADEETATAKLERLDAEGVPAGATCLGEVERLLEGIAPVWVHPDVQDRPVPRGLVYEEDRMDAIEDHLGRVGAMHRMGPDGFEVVPESDTAPVWTIRGGEDGVLIRSSRAMTDEGVYNAVVSRSETEDQVPLVGRAYHNDGPLAWDGPFGRVPMFHQSIATTANGVRQDAETLLTNRHATGSIPIDVACLLHPGVQMHDTVRLVAPSHEGETPMVGSVTAMSIAGNGGRVSKQTTMRLNVSAAVLDRLRGAGRV